VRAEGIIAEADYVRSQYLYIRPSPGLGWAVIGVVIAALIIGAIVASLPWIIAGVAAYLALWLLVFIPWHAKKNYRQYKALSEPVSIEVRDDGLFFKRDNGEGLVPWSHIVKWRQNKTLVLLYPASNIFHLIPSHFFPTHEAYEEFVTVVKGRCGNAR
jgi:hypothetical protein